MKYTLQALNKPEVAANADKCLEVMDPFKELSELHKKGLKLLKNM